MTTIYLIVHEHDVESLGGQQFHGNFYFSAKDRDAHVTRAEPLLGVHLRYSAEKAFPTDDEAREFRKTISPIILEANRTGILDTTHLEELF